MAQHLRAVVDFAEDQGSILHTHMAAHTGNPSSRESEVMHVVDICACWQNIYTHRINMNKI